MSFPDIPQAPPRPTTPIREGVGGFQGRRHLKDFVDPLILSDLMGTIRTGLPVEDFIRYIWQYSLDRLPWEEKQHILQLDPGLVAGYVSTLGEHEPVRYAPFVRMLDDARSKIRQAVPDIESPCPVQFEPLGSQNVKGNKNFRKPDVSLQSLAALKAALRMLQEGKRPSMEWLTMPSFMEFKTDNKKDDDPDPTPKAMSAPDTTTDVQVSLKRKASSEDVLPRPKRMAVSPTASTNSDTDSITESRKPVGFSPGSWGAESSSVKLEGSVDRNVDVSADDEVKTKTSGKGDEVAGVGVDLILEPADGERGDDTDRLPTPPAVETSEASFSRTAARDRRVTTNKDGKGNVRVCRKPPVLDKDELQTAGYASECLGDGRRRYVTGFYVVDLMMSFWYYDRMGVIQSKEFNIVENPRFFFLALAAITECDMERFGYEPMIRPPSMILPPLSAARPIPVEPPQKLDNWEIHIDEGVNADNEPVPGVVQLKITGSPIYVQPGIVGRGTSVMPVTAMAGSESKLGVQLQSKLVVKFSWPAASRPSEDGLIRHIRKRIGPVEARHITRMRISTTLEGARLGLPRIQEALWAFSSHLENRVLRVIVCDQLRPLKDLERIADFQSVFLDLVRGHRVVFKRAHVLHRDLSINNVMFDVDAKGKPYGVIIDWDLSLNVEAKDGVADVASAQHRTGTGPFIAIDLLDSFADSPHFYRHDLESFFYLLIWCATGFLLGGKETRKREIKEKDWTVLRWTAMQDFKVALLDSPSKGFPKLNEAMTEPFKPLFNTWVRPLAAMISRARRGVDQDMDDGVYHDPETMGGRMTYRKFMESLGVDFGSAPHNLDLDLLD